MSKLPSPCIGVCKFRLAGRHCIACSMTKPQKSIFKKIKKDAARADFITMLSAQQAAVGSAKGWSEAYSRRCTKKGAKLPRLLRLS